MIASGKLDLSAIKSVEEMIKVHLELNKWIYVSFGMIWKGEVVESYNIMSRLLVCLSIGFWIDMSVLMNTILFVCPSVNRWCLSVCQSVLYRSVGLFVCFYYAFVYTSINWFCLFFSLLVCLFVCLFACLLSVRLNDLFILQISINLMSERFLHCENVFILFFLQ